MKFDYTSEQVLLRDSVRRSFEALPTGRDRMQAGTAEEALPRFTQTAETMAALGIPGLLAPEEAGGLGLGAIEAMLVAVEAGRCVSTFPVCETVLATALLATASPDLAQSALSGAEIATLATRGKLRPAPGSTTKFSGSLRVPYARQARWAAAPIAFAGGPDAVALLDLAGAGIGVAAAHGLDLGYSIDRVTCDAVAPVALLYGDNLASLAPLLACGELIGVSARLLETTIAYLRQRRQFGMPIGANQGVKHIAADDRVALDSMRVATDYAAWAWDAHARGELDADTRRTALAVAKSYASEAARKIAEHAMQLHGGIAFTWEYGLHLGMRRILRLAGDAGTSQDHREALARLLLDGPELLAA